MTEVRRHQGRIAVGIAGAVAAGSALGAGELLAGMFASVPSPTASVGAAIVDWSPPFAKDFAISVFGTADKGALAIGTVLIALIIGWYVGIGAARRTWVGPAALGAFGLLGMVAGFDQPLTSVPAVAGASLVSVGAGVYVLFMLLDRAEQVESPTDALPADRSRRRFLRLAAVTGVGAVVAGAVGRRMLTAVPDTIEGTVSGAGTAAAPPGSEHSFDVPGLTPVVVPNDEFYRIDTALIVPRIEPEDWRLTVRGLVDEEISIDYDELLGMEHIEEYVTLSCVSNDIGGDLVGNALWTGVPLAEVLERAGVMPEAGQIVGRSVDNFTAGFPIEVAFDGRQPMIAIAMNGEPLPRSHGYPARLVVPGLYGYVSATKWLSAIELHTWDGFNGYWVPRGWSKEGPIKTQSRIDMPGAGDTVPVGAHTAAGVAWAPTRGIEKVEVRVDEGEWEEAEITTPLSSQAWVQWKAEVVLTEGRHFLAVRATDGDGVTQTDERSRARPDGATGHHTVRLWCV